MSAVARKRDEYTRTLLIRVLAECGENRDNLETLSQLELIECVREKCMWDTGQFTALLVTLFITVNCDKEMISLRLEHSEEERAKAQKRIKELEETLRTREREQAMLSHRLSVAHARPGLEALRVFLTNFACESSLDDLLLAGIDSIDKLCDAARRRGALGKTGIHPDVIAVMRRELKKK